MVPFPESMAGNLSFGLLSPHLELKQQSVTTCCANWQSYRKSFRRMGTDFAESLGSHPRYSIQSTWLGVDAQ